MIAAAAPAARPCVGDIRPRRDARLLKTAPPALAVWLQVVPLFALAENPCRLTGRRAH